jgi:hypothetical protein
MPRRNGLTAFLLPVYFSHPLSMILSSACRHDALQMPCHGSRLLRGTSEMLDISQIETLYANSGALNIAYQLFGDGELNLVLIPGWASNVENIWSLTEFGDFAQEVAQFAKVILLDRRGTGLSDPVADPPTLEERMDDVRAVIDAAGWDRAVIWGISEGGRWR